MADIPSKVRKAAGAVGSTPPLLHVADLVFDTPLAIIPAKLDAILRGVGHRIVGKHSHLQEFLDSGALIGNAPLHTYWDDEDDDPKEPVRPYSLIDGVAVIPVSGTLMDQGGWMSALSGCSSYQGIAKAVRMAMDEDASVKSILFRVNSPGGSTNGCFELCDLIYGYRGKKPMQAVASHLAASAAYAIASSADKVYVTLTGGVGSVGVFALHCDQSKADEKYGLSFKYIKYGAKKTDGNPHEPLSTSAESDIQAEVDRQGLMFSERVARNRGVSRTKIINLEAAVFCGEEAVGLLADAISTYDAVLADLSRKGLDNSGRLSSEHSAPKMFGGIDPMAANKKYADGKKACPDCDGENPDCPTCGGSGEVEATVSLPAPVAASASAPPPTPPNPNPPAAPAPPASAASAAPTSPAPAAAAPPLAPPPNPPNPPMENTDMSTANAATATLAAQSEIMDLCAIAGYPADKTLEFLSKEGTTVASVKTALKEWRIGQTNPERTAPGSAAGGGTGASGDPLMTIYQNYQVSRTNQPHATPSSLLEASIRANPQAYEMYQEQREDASLSRSATRAFLAVQKEKFRMMGLSTVS